MYVKVKGDELIKYPYTMQDMQEENPFTQYDERFDLKGWYSKTEEAESTGQTVEYVEMAEMPDIDDRTETLEQRKLPSYQDGKWVIMYDVIKKTEEEIEAWDNTPPPSSIPGT